MPRRPLARTLLATALALSATAASPAGLPRLTDIEDLPLHYGINTLPGFTPDGKAATIVMAHRDNGNAHGHDTILMWVEGPRPSPRAPGTPQIIAVEGSDDVVRNEPFDGEREIRAVRFVHARIGGARATLLVEAERHFGAAGMALTDSAPTELRIWRLDGPDDGVGRTPYMFQLIGRAEASRPYCNATTALHRELGLSYPDGWDNGDSVDGCATPAVAGMAEAAMQMVRALDMTSFANSIGPRREAARHTLADYGFTRVHSFPDGWVEVAEPDGSWSFGLLVLEDGARRKLLCVTDTARNGGTYRAAGPIEVVPGPRGLWGATAPRHASVPGCANEPPAR